MKELWKDIPNYEGAYQASTLGRVRNAKRKIIAQGKTRTGYCKVTLHSKGLRKYFETHRVIALTFLPNPNNLETVHHINRIVTDNRTCNLMWCSLKDNVSLTRGSNVTALYKELIDVFRPMNSVKEVVGYLKQKCGFN